MQVFGPRKIEVQSSSIKHFAHARTACGQQRASILNIKIMYTIIYILEFTVHISPTMTPTRLHHLDAGLHTPSLQCCRELVVAGFCRTKGGC